MNGTTPIQRLTAGEITVGLAALFYVAAFALMTANLSVGNIEIGFAGLAILSLVLVVIRIAKDWSSTVTMAFNTVHILVGGIIAGRYLVYFFYEFAYVSVLLLFLAVVGFAAGVVIKLISLIRELRQARKPGGQAVESSPSE